MDYNTSIWHVSIMFLKAYVKLLTVHMDTAQLLIWDTIYV